MSSTDKIPSARLVFTMGPVALGDSTTTIDAPDLAGNTRPHWIGNDIYKNPRPTLGVPKQGTIIQAYFPAHIINEPHWTAVHSLTQNGSDKGSLTSCTNYVLQHDLFLGKASEVTFEDTDRNTRRVFSFGEDKRDIAHVVISNQFTAMAVNLTQGGDRFHLTLDPTQTGKASVCGVMRSRNGGNEWAKEGVSHTYYNPEGGRVTEWKSKENEV